MAVKNVPNYTNDDGYGSPLNIRRGNPNPLDNSYLWKTFEEAALYAKESPIAYVGQLIATYDKDKDNKEIVALYMINDTNGTLLPILTKESFSDTEVDMADMKTKIAALIQKQTDLETSITNMSTSISDMQGNISDMQTDVSNALDTIDDQNDDILKIKLDIGPLIDESTNKSNLPEGASNLVEAIQKLSGKVTEIEEDDDYATEDDIDDIYSDIFKDLNW